MYLAYECILYLDCTFLEEKTDFIFCYTLEEDLCHYCNFVSINATIEASVTVYSRLGQP